MSKLTGIFETFHNLEAIPTQNFLHWLQSHPNPLLVENFLANRMLYPQAVPEQVTDLDWDMAILREALRTSHEFIDLKTLKIFIPESLFARVPDLSKLAWIFIDAYLIGWVVKNPGKNVWTVVLRRSEGDETLGSVIIPEFQGNDSSMNLTIRNKNTQVKKGQLSVIPCAEECKFNFSVNNGSVLGVTQGLMRVPGGKLGLVVDGR